MLFFDSRACRQNLTANAFGTNLAQLASERVTVRYPSASGRAGDVLARRGSTLNGASVSAIRFSRPQGVPGTSRGYVSFLEIGLTSGGTGATSPARVPFYFVTNASNQLVDCWATTIPSPSSMPMATIEDATCRQLKGPGTVYNPATRTCIAVSTVAGP